MNLEITVTYGQNKQKTYSTSCTLTGLGRKMQLLAEDIRDEILRPQIAEDIEREIARLQSCLIEPKYLIMSPDIERELQSTFPALSEGLHFMQYRGLRVVLADINGWSIGV